MTETSAQKKGLWGMTRPLFVEQALQFSVPALDTFFLSRVSDSAASAAGAMTPVVYFCINILWAIVFSGASIAGQRLGAGNHERTAATIAIYGCWALFFGGALALALNLLAPSITRLMGLPGEIGVNAEIYLSIISLMMIVMAAKQVFQSILNIYGQPHWNMYANFLFFASNVAGNSIVVFGLFGFPKQGIAGVAWASVCASLSAVIFSALVVFIHIKLVLRWQDFLNDFRRASHHLFRIAVPGVMEPLSFNINLMILNSFTASLGAAALAAKIYTFNTFMLGLIITIALATATQVLISQYVGAGNYDKAAKLMKQSLKTALWGAGIVAVVLVAASYPVMDIYTDNEILLGGAFWLFLLSGLSEPSRAVNVIVGFGLRATGDGFLISVIGPLFTWLVALPAAYVFAFVFEWGVYGILLSALLDEGGRSLMYWKRWNMNRWHYTHVHARETKLKEKSAGTSPTIS